MYPVGRREFAALLTSGVVISAWALFPGSTERGIYVPFPEASTLSATGVMPAGQGPLGGPAKASRFVNAGLISANLMETKPASQAPVTSYGSVTAGYAGPVVDVGQVPLRSKLQALLMLLHSQPGDLDPVALEAKIQALLQLPDPVLEQLMAHPDLADLNEMLDAVFFGTSDVAEVKTQLDKIDVAPVPGTYEQIQVIRVNGKPQYTVHAPVVDRGTDAPGVAQVSAPPPPGGPVTIASQFQTLTDLTMSAFMPAPSSAQLAPPSPPAPPPPPPPPEARVFAPAMTFAPSIEQFAPTQTPTATP
jgi:hypothetical protein